MLLLLVAVVYSPACFSQLGVIHSLGKYYKVWDLNSTELNIVRLLKKYS
jgi:hypothetical protein